MTDTQMNPMNPPNPFDPETFNHGGGLWDGKEVTFTKVEVVTEPLKFKDGTAVFDDKGHPLSQTGLKVSGIAAGEEKERSEMYTAGGKLAPAPDGEGFVSLEGSAPRFHANSNVGKFLAALKASGFDVSVLIVDGKQRVSRLVGARFMMRGEHKLGRDGKPLQDKKGYDKMLHLPVKFVGFVAGLQSMSMTSSSKPVAGNGDAIIAKTEGAVLKALANGPLTRADLVRTLAQSLAGDADANAIIALVVRDDFHAGRPWKYDGLRASL